MKNALNNQVGMRGDMFLWLVANLKQGVIYFIKQALPPNISAGSVITPFAPFQKAQALYALIYCLNKPNSFFLYVFPGSMQ